MRLPDFFRPSHSIASRLTWRVVGALLFISVTLAVIFFVLLWTVGLLVLSAFFWTRMDVSEEKINNVFTAVEIALSNNVPEVHENIAVAGKEYFAIERLIQLNPNIVGAAVALNPEYEPRIGQRFAPYAFRDTTGIIKDIMLNSSQYDYLHKEWYVKPLNEGKGVWTEPYHDEGGGEMMMTTYSLPVFNNKGEIYAVQTADISLDWLAKLTQQVDSINNVDYYLGFDDNGRGHTFSFIVSAMGKVVVHPDGDVAHKKSLLDILKESKVKDAEQMAKSMLSGNKDVTTLKYKDGKLYFLFSTPIVRTGWAFFTMVPISDLLIPVNYFVSAAVITLLLGLLIVALICRSSIHRITKPIRLFADSADEIARGHLDTPLPNIDTKDEMKRLHNSFTTMQQSLVSQIEQIKIANAEKGRIEGELLIARNIQMSMLPMTFPAFPDRKDMDIYAQLTPAKEVGGDLYDFLIRDEKLYFCIGDVSGKGIPAAMVMSVTRALFRTASSHESNPGKIIAGINELIVEDNNSNMFVTLFIGVLDLPTGRLRYSNAGHNPPLWIEGKEVTMMPCDANLPLGVMADWKFTTQETLMKSQSMVFLYTDGLTEAETDNLEQFQEQRMMDEAEQAEREPEKLIQKMEAAVREFVGDADQSDDLTMLAIQYTKSQNPDDDARLSRSITLTNDVEQVPQLAAFVDEVCEELEIDMGTVMSMNLAIEEAVVNVMSYAYPAGTVGDIIVEAKANDTRLKFIITDWGKPFDPTAKEDIDTTQSAEERHIGGLGIHLVRQIMDSINYERTAGKNVLTLRKKLS